VIVRAAAVPGGNGGGEAVFQALDAKRAASHGGTDVTVDWQCVNGDCDSKYDTSNGMPQRIRGEPRA